METVLMKPLYIFSVISFTLSLILLPFNFKWSVITILILIGIWSRVPGFVHFIFTKLAINDLFTFIVAAEAGALIGAFYGIMTVLFARVFGPYEWWPYTIRATITAIVASLITPSIIKLTGAGYIEGFLYFQSFSYIFYSTLVVLFWRDELALEIALLPLFILFDFIMNIFLIKLFGNTLSNMFNYGINSGWPFIIFAGIILGFWIIVKNGEKIAAKVMVVKSKLNIENNKYFQKLEKILQE